MINLKLRLYHGICNHVQVIKYPDGQQTVKLDMNYFNDPKMPVELHCSIRNWQELELLSCIMSALEHTDHVIDKIFFYYLFGLRSDRVFTPGQPNYLKDVLAPYVNNLLAKVRYDKRILAPHGRWHHYMPKLSNYINLDEHLKKFNGYQGICADESATDLYETVTHDYELQIIPHFVKSRYLSDDMCITLPQQYYEQLKLNNKPILVIDDLCDGGATFLMEGRMLRELFPDRRIELFVYHGLFNKGIGRLTSYYDHIWMTNSYQSLEHSKLTVLEVI